MSLSNDLLTQARQLATKERKRPRQASLRRAVSAAYYALFHLLTGEAVQTLVRGSSAHQLRNLLRRAFQHRDMKEAAKGFAGGTPAGSMASAAGTLSQDLVAVAAAFVELQEARHQADYDLSRSFSRRETLDLVELAEDAFARWKRIRKQNDAKAFLVALLANRSLKAR